MRLKIILLFIGSCLGPLNIALYFFLGTRFQSIPFYLQLNSLSLLTMWTGFWMYLLFLPCVLGTALTLGMFWQDLYRAVTLREHIAWGITFGAMATVCSTGFFILLGVFYNYSKGLSSPVMSIVGVGLSIPATIVLGLFFIVIFFPMIAVSGAFYGLTANWLKNRYSIVREKT